MFNALLEFFANTKAQLKKFRDEKYSNLIRSIRLSILEKLNSELFTPRVAPELKDFKPTLAPYANFSHQPAQISQIKKIINALYHAEQSLIGLETFANENCTKQPWEHVARTLEHTYRASYLVTHIDVNLHEIFGKELRALGPLFQMLKSIEEKCGDEQRAYLLKIKEFDLPQKAGSVSGIIVDQMNPQGGEADYAFLTQISAVLPGYLDRLRGYIETFSSKVAEYKPHIDQIELDELHNYALELLNSLGEVRDSRLFLSLKIPHYIYIIRHTILLSMSIIRQFGHLNDSSQNVIREQLTNLKYKVLPSLFGLVDKVEEQLLLRPGTLSQPLMKTVSSFYKSLISFIESYVDFEEEGRELLNLEDSKYVEKRLDFLFNRCAEDEENWLKVENAQNASDKLFALLQQLIPPKGKKDLSLDKKDKELLAEHYKVIQPYVLQFDVSFNDDLIDVIKSRQGYVKTLVLNRLLKFQTKLDARLNKELATLDFQLGLKYDLIRSIYAASQETLQVFPYNSEDNPFINDEASLLGVNLEEINEITEPEEEEQKRVVREGDELDVDPIEPVEKEEWDIAKEEQQKEFDELAEEDNEDEDEDEDDETVQAERMYVRNIKNTIVTNASMVGRGIFDLAEWTGTQTAKLMGHDVELAANEQSKSGILDMIPGEVMPEPGSNPIVIPDASAANIAIPAPSSNTNQTVKTSVGSTITNVLLWPLRKAIDFFSPNDTNSTTDATPSVIKPIPLSAPVPQANNEPAIIASQDSEQQADLVSEEHSEPDEFFDAEILNDAMALDEDNLLRIKGLNHDRFELEEKHRADDESVLVENLILDDESELVTDPAEELIIINDSIGDEEFVMVDGIPPDEEFVIIEPDGNIPDFLPDSVAEPVSSQNIQALGSQQRFELEVSAFLDEANPVLNLNVLSAKQAFTLYQYYKIKRVRLELAAEKYIKFCEILNDQSREDDDFILTDDDQKPINTVDEPRVIGAYELLNDVDEATKKELLHLYRFFQPYLIGGLFPIVGGEFHADLDIISALSHQSPSTEMGEPNPQPINVTLAQVGAYGDQMLKLFLIAHERTNKRCQDICDIIGKLINKGNKNNRLVKDESHTERVHHVVKREVYSKTVAEIRAFLAEQKVLFNNAINNQLVEQPANQLPYPELEKPLLALAQSTPVMALKRLFNCFYNLENMCLELESLKDNGSQHRYAFTVIKAYVNLKDAIELANALVKDPYWFVLADNIKHKLDEFYTQFKEVRGYYIPETEEEKLPELPEGIEPPARESRLLDVTASSTRFKSILYALNTIYVTPEHIDALYRGQNLTQLERDSIHKHTEEVTEKIEEILDKSSSYFKLFLEIPTMLGLYNELKEKFIEMAKSTHRAVRENLDYINNVLLTSLMKVADSWEDDYFLAPGTITDPLKNVLDTFYKGLLAPLGLDSPEYMRLVSDPSPINERFAPVQARASKARIEQIAIKEQQQLLRQLLKSIDSFNKGKRGNLIKDFKAVAKILIEAKPNFTKMIDIPESNGLSEDIDTLLNDNNPGEEELKNIPALTKACLSYFEGLSATKQLIIDTATEKEAYLNELNAAQKKIEANDTMQFATKDYEKKAADLVSMHVGLVHCRDEYMDELRKFLNESKADIVAEAKNKLNIGDVVSRRLAEKEAQFKAQNSNYFRLEMVLEAITKLDQYLSNANSTLDSGRSIFENITSIKNKTDIAGDLRRIATNKDRPPEKKLSVEKRLEELRGIVTNDWFKTAILKYERADSWTFKRISQLLIKLLDLLGINASGRQRCLSKLKKSVELPKGSGRAVSQNGFFSASQEKSISQRNYEAPTVKIENGAAA